MSNQQWLKAYRTDKNSVWVKCKLCIGEYVYINNFSKQWKALKDRCDKEKVYIKELSLQFRSHEVKLDISDVDGIYLVRSVKGQVGGKTQHYYTFGRVFGDKVHKQKWLTPELILEESFDDHIDQCFKEIIIYDEFKKRENREE